MKRNPNKFEVVQQQVGQLQGEVSEIKGHVSSLTKTIQVLNDTIQEVIHTSRENLSQSRSTEFKHSKDNMEKFSQGGKFDLRNPKHNSKEELDNLSEDEPGVIAETSPSEERNSPQKQKTTSQSFQYTEKYTTDKFTLKSGCFSHSSDEDLSKNKEARSRRRYSLEMEMRFGVATAQNMQGSKMEDTYRVIPFQKSPPRHNTSSKQEDISQDKLSSLQHAESSEMEPPEKRRRIEQEITARPKYKENSIIVHEKSDSPDGLPNYAFFAVYDGHGGPQAADYARTFLHANIVNHQSFKSEPAQAIREGFAQTETQFIDSIYTANRGIHGVGTTAVVALIYAQNSETALYVAHVGDSEAILCR